MRTLMFATVLCVLGLSAVLAQEGKTTIDPKLVASWAASDKAIAAEVRTRLETLQKTPEFKAYEAALASLRTLREGLDKQAKAIQINSGWDVNTGKLIVPSAKTSSEEK